MINNYRFGNLNGTAVLFVFKLLLINCLKMYVINNSFYAGDRIRTCNFPEFEIGTP